MDVIIPQKVRPTYQLQWRRCGKASCRSFRPRPGHGPYWYAYWRESSGKLRARSVGKVLPSSVVLSPRQHRRWAHHLARRFEQHERP